MMTELEAKQRWCPMVRVSMIPNPNAKGVSIAANRDISFFVPPNSFDPKTDITRCIASTCMVWRWDAEPYERSRTAVHVSVVGHWEGMGYKKGAPAPDKGDDWFWMEPTPPNHIAGTGYCGLGGKP